MEIPGHLDSDTKILVASEGSGLSQREDGLASKVQACKANFDIPIVTMEWMYASLSAGRPVEVEAYLATDEYLGMPRADPPFIAEDATSGERAAAAAAAAEGMAKMGEITVSSEPTARSVDQTQTPEESAVGDAGGEGGEVRTATSSASTLPPTPHPSLLLERSADDHPLRPHQPPHQPPFHVDRRGGRGPDRAARRGAGHAVRGGGAARRGGDLRADTIPSPRCVVSGGRDVLRCGADCEQHDRCQRHAAQRRRRPS